MRVTRADVRVEADRAQHLVDAGVPAGTRVPTVATVATAAVAVAVATAIATAAVAVVVSVGAEAFQRFGDDRADGHPGVQRAERVL